MIKKQIGAAYTGLALLACASLMQTTPAFAATQGSIGATSQGTINIQASVPSRARISGLNDVSFLNQDPTSDASSSQDVCVWSNTTTKAYTITASGDGAAGAFTLTDGSGTVPYSVEWSSSAGQSSGSALSTGVASVSLLSTATNQSCASGPSSSASLIVKLASADLSTMATGSTYAGTLTLLVTPQ